MYKIIEILKSLLTIIETMTIVITTDYMKGETTVQSADKRMQRYQYLLEKGWLTQNEVRMLCGLDPIGDLADVLPVKTTQSNSLQLADSADSCL